LLPGQSTLQCRENQVLSPRLEGKIPTVAIKPSRQFEKKKPPLDEQLKIAKIRKLDADTAKEIQETQLMIQQKYGPNSPSKGP